MLISIMFFPQTVFAQTVPDIGLLPNHPLYDFKLFFENLQEQFEFNDARRAEILLEHAEVRRAEIDVLERGNFDIPVKVVRIQLEKFQKAEEIINKLEGAPLTRAIPIDPLREPNRNELEKILDTDSDETKIIKLKERLRLAFSDRQVSDIKLKFNEVVTERDVEKRRILAERLDNQVNTSIINLSCFGRINTLEIADSIDPVRELQDQCLLLKAITTDELRRIMQNAG